MHRTPFYKICPETTLLLGVDFQKAFGEVIKVPKAGEAVSNFCCAARDWRDIGGTVCLTKHVILSESEAGNIIDFIPKIHDVVGFNSYMLNFTTEYGKKETRSG